MIKIEKLNKTYDRRSRNANHVLKDVSFQLPDTGFVCILGPSGCGKTSLLNAIGGLDKFDNGTISTENVSVSRYGKRIYEAERNANFGYIFQNYYLLPEHSVAYNVYLGLHSLKLSHREKLKRVRQALEAVDMSRYIRRKVGELSGGQQQRIAIARALARRPKVIFADEPTGNLDEANTMNICSLLRRISRESLVIMVTHEERIANFFADRIIRLDGGVVAKDDSDWQRSGLSTSNEKEIYAGDLQEARFRENSVSLRVLQEEGAAPVEVTVVALKDRILIKLTDNRATSCGEPQEIPALKEGKRPTVTLDSLDSGEDRLVSQGPAPQARAGHGVRFGMMLQEAKHLRRTGGAKGIGMRVFLILLTVLTMWTMSDYMTVSAVDPRDFITTDSHILEIKLKRGGGSSNAVGAMADNAEAYREFIDGAPTEFTYLPSMDMSVNYAVRLFHQMSDATVTLYNFNCVPQEALEEDTLICGRAPQRPGEVVVDRWVLDELLERDSIISNAVSNVEVFLGEQLYFSRCNYYVRIVGICDSGEPAMYVNRSDVIRITGITRGLLRLSDLQAAYPGEYDDVVLADNECLVNSGALGSSYDGLIGKLVTYKEKDNFIWTIKDTVRIGEPAGYIVSDSEAERYIRVQCSTNFLLYCEDKAAMKEYLLNELPQELDDKLIIDIVDEYADAWDAYTEASQMKVDARTIVTVTVIVIAMVMLYLLCRAQAQERIGMLAVYRLLGIPGRKLRAIFALEGLVSSLYTALPTAVLSYIAVQVITMIPELELDMILPWQAAVVVYLAILAYHLLVAVLPLGKLLRLPPAQLAAKYDY